MRCGRCECSVTGVPHPADGDWSGAAALKRLRVRSLLARDSTGLPISTYFSAIKLRWMIDHHENVKKAHEEDDLMFGTVESWIVYVRFCAS